MDIINFKYDSGIYALLINLNKSKKIKIGAKGFFDFPEGYYIYCGTAQRNLHSRLERHHKQTKKMHWHIDYLLAEANLKYAYTWPVASDGECSLATYLYSKLGGKIIIPGFGSSDCNCKSHLLYFSHPVEIENLSDDFFNS